MADNPNKRKADGNRISEQPYEQAYQHKKATGKADFKTKKPVKAKQSRISDADNA